MPLQARALRRAIDDWSARGMVDPDTAARLRDDLDGRTRTYPVSGILIVMAALLLGAAILVFAAPNWGALSRPAQLMVSALIVVAANAGGVWAAKSGRVHVAEGLWLIGSAGFAAGLVLASEDARLSDATAGLIFVWWLSAVAGAVVYPSRALTVLSVPAAVAWFAALEGHASGTMPHVAHLLVAMLAVSWLLSARSSAPIARDLALVASFPYIFVMAGDWGAWPATILLMLSVAAFASTISDPDGFARRVGTVALPQTHFLALFLFAGLLLGFEVDRGVPRIAVAAVMLAGLVGALVSSGRLGAGLRALIYMGFAWQLFALTETAFRDTLGTFGFLAISAALVAVSAWIVFGYERRSRARLLTPSAVSRKRSVCPKKPLFSGQIPFDRW